MTPAILPEYGVAPPVPEFTWRALHIRYNVEDAPAYAIHVTDSFSLVAPDVEGPAPFRAGRDRQTTLMGILSLLGFTPENCRITDCHFELDASLAPGTMAVAPLTLRTSPTHDPEEAKGDGISDDTDAIQRGGWWPKRGESYTSPTHPPRTGR